MKTRSLDNDRVIARILCWPLIPSLWIWFIAGPLRTYGADHGYTPVYWLLWVALLAATVLLAWLINDRTGQTVSRDD
jgi:hypothetical protein